MRKWMAASAVALMALAGFAELANDETGSATLPAERSTSWVWVHDYGAGGRSILVDVADGAWLGALPRSYLSVDMVMPAGQRLFTVDTYYTRGVRGERTDTVNAIDWPTLATTGETVIPPKKMVSIPPHGMVALTGDERFIAVQNFTPTQSVTVVNLDTRELTTEVQTPGCHAIYPSGDRQLNVICGGGGFLSIKLDADGKLVSQTRTDDWFDKEDGPVEMRAGRIGDTYYFVNLIGEVVPVSFDADGNLVMEPRFRYATDAEIDDGWTAAGLTQVAVDASAGRLYVLMQSGGEAEHESPGSEVWVFDVATTTRINRIELEHIAIGVAMTHGDDPYLLANAFVLPIPGWAAGLLYLFGNEEVFERISEAALDVYDADGNLLRTIEDLAQWPIMIQPVPINTR